MPASPPKGDIALRRTNGRFGPRATFRTAEHSEFFAGHYIEVLGAGGQRVCRKPLGWEPSPTQ
jgi:hypothetical protein